MERRREVVLDSSVVVKWFSREAGSDEALRLMDSHVDGSVELSVSELLLCEVANALRYKPDYDAEKLKYAVNQLFRLHLNVISLTEDLLGRAGEIAYNGDVTLYDALPVALAEHRKTLCITADEETKYGKVRMKGYPVELLSAG
jgi:predicted nucleic acid-binding protein